MGLVVYLYRCPDRNLARLNEAEYEKATEGITDRLMKERFKVNGWSEFDKLSQTQKDEFWSLYKAEKAPHAQRLGIDDERSAHASDEKIEHPSALHPDHYFKIGYFRSSYNEGGYNSYAERLGIPTLSAIFDNEDGEYEFVPDWAASKDRAVAALATLKEKDFGFDVDSIKPNVFSAPEITSENQALQLFKTEQARESSFEAYSNGHGTYWKKGQQVYAALPGFDDFLGRKIPCVYLITKREGPNWYAQALEIVIETCNWVLEQPNRDQLYMHWSG